MNRYRRRPFLSLGVTTSSTAEKAEQLQTCRWRQPAWPTVQGLHKQVTRLLWRDRHDELADLPIELNMNARVSVQTERSCW
jgi:hypothetical protein